MKFTSFFNKINSQLLNSYPFSRYQPQSKSNADLELEAIMERHEKMKQQKKS